MFYFIQTSATYSSLISTLCDGGNTGDACTDDIAALSSNTACDPTEPTVCTEVCRSLYDDISDNCDATVSGYI